MKIVVYCHEQAGLSGKVLLDSIADCRGAGPLERITSMEALTRHLRTLGSQRGNEILVLLAESRDRLVEVMAAKRLLEDRRTVIVVPDDDPATLSSAHKLFPRFVTPVADQYQDLCSVICRMVARYGATSSPSVHP